MRHRPEGTHRTARRTRARTAWLGASLLLVAIVAVTLAAGMRRGTRGPVAPDPAPAPAAARDLAPAPDMTIDLYQGERALGARQVALADLWARGPVVLNFWAGLCPPCRVEMPDLEDLSRENAGRVHLIAVDVGPFVGLGSTADGQALLRELGVTFPAGTTADAQAVRRYQIVGMPSTLFITSRGTILRRHIGMLTRAQMDAFLDELLRQEEARR